MITVHKRPNRRAAAYSLLAALMSAAIVGRAGVRDVTDLDTLPRKVRYISDVPLAPRKVEMSICTFYANNNLHPIRMCGIFNSADNNCVLKVEMDLSASLANSNLHSDKMYGMFILIG